MPSTVQGFEEKKQKTKMKLKVFSADKFINKSVLIIISHGNNRHSSFSLMYCNSYIKSDLTIIIYNQKCVKSFITKKDNNLIISDN